MRLIDADALMQTYAKFVAPSNNSDFENEPTWNDAVSLLESAPTVDHIKHGHWIIRDIPGTYFYQITCSECSEDVTSSAPCIGFLPNAKVLWDYCPYCGAKMDEVEKDGDT